jgi:ribosome modulation factor
MGDERCWLGLCVCVESGEWGCVICVRCEGRHEGACVGVGTATARPPCPRQTKHDGSSMMGGPRRASAAEQRTHSPRRASHGHPTPSSPTECPFQAMADPTGWAGGARAGGGLCWGRGQGAGDHRVCVASLAHAAARAGWPLHQSARGQASTPPVVPRLPQRKKPRLVHRVRGGAGKACGALNKTQRTECVE